jgi:hypothetical protein
MTQRSKREYVEAVRKRYIKSDKQNKGRILDEVCAVLECHRKAAVRLINQKPKPCTSILSPRRGRKKQYTDPQIVETLVHIWQHTNLKCSKLLVSSIPIWLPHYPKPFKPAVEEQLRKISASTIDRLLKPKRGRYYKRGLATTKPGSLLKKKIPIQTEQWDEKHPGFLEADTVAHCGSSVAGEYVFTINMVDIATGWVEDRAVWGKTKENAMAAIVSIEEALPFRIRGFDSDNGNEFINHALYEYFHQRKQPVRFTRSREYHKNDNAHVESKNWSLIRQYLGYERFGDIRIVALLNDLFQNEWRLLMNGFIPSFKLVAKERKGSKIIKKYDAPKTPLTRVLESSDTPKYVKQQLKKIFKHQDPFALSEAVSRKIKTVMQLVNPTIDSDRPATIFHPTTSTKTYQSLKDVLDSLFPLWIQDRS